MSIFVFLNQRNLAGIDLEVHQTAWVISTWLPLKKKKIK